MENLANKLERFVTETGDVGEETSQAYEVYLQDTSCEEIRHLIDLVESVSEFVVTERITIKIIGEFEDQYQIQYDPYENSIVSSQTDGSEYDVEDTYSTRETVANNLTDIREGTLSNVDNTVNALSEIKDGGDFTLVARYRLHKTRVEEYILGELSSETLSVKFGISWERLENEITSVSVEGFKSKYLSNSEKLLFVVLEDVGASYGSSIAFSGLSVVSQFIDEFLAQETKWKDLTAKIGKSALIEKQKEHYLPPLFFQISRSVNGGFERRYEAIFQRNRVMGTILSVASNCRYQENSVWTVSIQGRQYIQGTLDFSEINKLVVRDDTDQTLEYQEDVVDHIEELFIWAYRTDEFENRVTVLRNVITLYARSLFEVLSDAEMILNSAESNLQYYLRESFDEFFDFRQDMMEGSIQIQREFSNLRNELMNDISRDVFRTFGFIIVVIIGTALRIDNVLPGNTALLIVTTIVFIYGVITFRRVRSISKQFAKQTNNHQNLSKFYQKFFEDREMKSLGLIEETHQGLMCNILGKIILRDQDQTPTTCRFRLDLLLYYLLTVSILLVSLAIIIDLHLPNQWIQTDPIGIVEIVENYNGTQMNRSLVILKKHQPILFGLINS